MSKSLNELRDEIHVWAVGKGWWSRPADTIACKVLLVHSEVSEAAECLRDARPCPHGSADVDWDDIRELQYEHPFPTVTATTAEYEVVTEPASMKPVGFASEIADTIIRLLDICARVGIDIDEAVASKVEYNHYRSQRHGGKGL